MMRIKISFVLLIMTCLAWGDLYAQERYTIKYNVSGIGSGMAYLQGTYGYAHRMVDSAAYADGKILLYINSTEPVGIYRISFADSLYTDIIFNYENVTMRSDAASLVSSMIVEESKENKVYMAYSYLAGIINDSIEMIAATGDSMFEASGHVLTPALDSMRRRAIALNNRMITLSDSLMKSSKGLFVYNIIKAYQTPDYYAYLKQPDAKPYKNRLDFLRDHYFDNIDLADEHLLNTEILYRSITDYVNTFGDPPSTANYIRAIDTVMKTFAAYPKVRDYALELLLNTFENSSWEKVFIHLAETFLKGNPNIDDGAEMLHRAEVMKLLQPGNPAPPIEMKDAKGKLQKLADVEAKVTLVFFWGSECDHCHQVIPGLMALYDKYHPLGFEIYSVSVDLDEKGWKETLSKNKYPWINVCDFQGIEGGTLQLYNTWYTPGFYVLDADKRILAHPGLVSQIEEILNDQLSQ